MIKIFCVEFQFHKNILPIYWKIQFLCNVEIWTTLRSKSFYAFLKCPPAHILLGVDGMRQALQCLAQGTQKPNTEHASLITNRFELTVVTGYWSIDLDYLWWVCDHLVHNI